MILPPLESFERDANASQAVGRPFYLLTLEVERRIAQTSDTTEGGLRKRMMPRGYVDMWIGYQRCVVVSVAVQKCKI